MILSTISLKGGSAKTTTNIQLAYYLHNLGFKVAVIDNDSQRSATDWLEDSEIAVISTSSHSEMEDELLAIKQDYDAIIVDCAAGDVLSLNIIIQYVDHCFIPLTTSALDINSTMDTLAEIRRARARSGKKIPVTLFLNNITKGSKIIAESLEVLESVNGYTLSDVMIPRTVRIQALPGEVESVFCSPKNRDLADLYTKLFEGVI